MLSWNSPKRSGYYSVVAVYTGSVVTFLRFKPGSVPPPLFLLKESLNFSELNFPHLGGKLEQECFVRFLSVLKP